MKKFIKGMVKDPERVDQPEATYRDALNANLYIQKGAIVNEQGTKIVANVSPAIVNIIGQCPLEDGRIVIFAIAENGHVISVISPKNGTYNVLYRNNDLNFQPDHTIEATAKVDTQGNILVYFTDNYLVRKVEPNTGISYIDDFNPPRVFNLTQQESSLETVLYNNIEYNVDKLDLFLHAGTIPQFNEVRIEDGGGVVSGTYHLALAYVDEDGNNTNYLVTSNAVHLVTAPENTIPTESITGDPQGSQSKKSITWEVTIPAKVNYSHVKAVVIQRFGGGLNQESSEFAYQLQDIKIPKYTNQDRELLITYTGLETIAQEDVAAVVIDNVRYESAKTLVQLNNQLYLSNLKSRGDIGYQRFANAIQLNAVTEKIEKFDPRYFDIISLNQGYTWFRHESLTTNSFNNRNYEQLTRFSTYLGVQKRNQAGLSAGQEDVFFSKVRKGYKDPKLFYKKKSYRRSEVYAFYISFVLKDGTETYAYHIPGREAEQIYNEITLYENSAIPEAVPANSNLNTQRPFNLTEIPKKFPDVKFYQMYDTQVMLAEQGIIKTTGFWENETEFYPSTPDFEKWGTDGDGVPIEQGTIQSQNVRHHKMPSNKLDAWKFIGEDPTSISKFYPTIGEDADANQSLKMFEDISILGIKLSNIRIPKFILRQVQGYKVYYAKRTQKDKTVLGQSVVIPSVLQPVVVPTMDRDLAAKSNVSRAWYMYGGIPSDSTHYPEVTNDGKSYKGISMFSFHDFNLLKNKHTLTSASHVDIQSVLVMKQYRGGPNIDVDPLVSGDYVNYEFPDWLNGDIENLVDPENPTADSNGQNAGVKIKAFVTSVLLAGAYYKPSDFKNSTLFTVIGSDGKGWLNDTNTVFAVKSDSITYLPGHQNLDVSKGSGFHGVDYLLNFSGESSIAIGLESGLPTLCKWTSEPDVVSGIFTNSPLFSWYTPNGYLNALRDEFNYTVLTLGNLDAVSTSPIGSLRFKEGWPVVYLVNLCSLKSDVYKSFDEQQLVWTGYYKDLSNVNLANGVDEDGKYRYYSGASSDNIFGGDTYIGRYSFRSTSQSYGISYYPWSDIPFDRINGNTGEHLIIENSSSVNSGITAATGLTQDQLQDEGYLEGSIFGGELLVKPWQISELWKRGNNTPVSTLFYFVCESDDLLGFRHIGDQAQGVPSNKSLVFDSSVASDVIFSNPTYDFTHMDNLLYMTNYSLNQDIRVTRPFPKKLNDVTIFPTRTIRSLDDEGSINDKYRFFQALEYKDLPRNRGDVFKLFTLGSILYLHTERSLFVTRGKQELQLGDNTQAYVGSGNIFEQDPDEVLPTTTGYGGCDSQFSALTTRYGQFFMNRRDARVYMYSESIIEISSLGMEKWFLDHIPFRLELLGMDLEAAGFKLDSPTAEFGFVAVYDPKFKRIILTKREKIPTETFNQEFETGNVYLQDGQFYSKRSGTVIELSNEIYFKDGGWTISYYPELQAWASRHSYIPRLYSTTAEEYYSLINYSDSNTNQVWEHSDWGNPGKFYNEVFNFEFEYIDNTQPGSSKVFSNIYYWADVVSLSSINYKETHKKTSTGFTDFYVYNTNQISGDKKAINYLSNSRLVDRVWNINDFRDMSRTTSITQEVVTGIPNVQGNFTTEVVNNLDSQSMFLEEGIVNPLYINENKSWFEQKRFVDHYLGVRLISDNSSNNLVYLYAAGTKHRQSFR